MAGSYPDAPAPRIPYDKNGTVYVWTRNTTETYIADQDEIERLNNESTDFTWTGNSTPFGNRPTGVKQGFIFPYLMDIRAMFLSVGNADSINALEFSTDTTNLIDGTWTTTTVVGKESLGTVKPGYRQSIASTVAPLPHAIKALRFTTNLQDGARYIRVIHLYGNVTSGEGEDRLRLWHPTLDEPLDDPTSADGAYFDWGDVTRGTVADKSFRVKNNSSSETANTITVSTDALTNTSPTLQSQITYSDGGAFASSINIGDLSPGEISSVITVRKTSSLSATLSLWTWRTLVTAGSWS